MDDRPTSRAQLAEAILEACYAAGLTPDQSAAYQLALEELGCLDVDKPSWIVKSVIFRIEKGFRPNPARLKTIQDVHAKKVDAWLADPSLCPIASLGDVQWELADGAYRLVTPKKPS